MEYCPAPDSCLAKTFLAYHDCAGNNAHSTLAKYSTHCFCLHFFQAEISLETELSTTLSYQTCKTNKIHMLTAENERSIGIQLAFWITCAFHVSISRTRVLARKILKLPHHGSWQVGMATLGKPHKINQNITQFFSQVNFVLFLPTWVY